MEVRKNQILIIDDDSRNIFALSAVLKARNYKCLSAISAIQGFEIVKQNPAVGVILLDMMMPDMDGYTAMAQMNLDDSLKNIPVIAVTAQAMMGDKERCLAAGAAGYVSKPVNVEELVKLLNRYI